MGSRLSFRQKVKPLAPCFFYARGGKASEDSAAFRGVLMGLGALIVDDTIFTLVALITRERLYRADKEDDLTPAEFGAVSIRIVSQILRDRSIVPDREAL